ncbi:DsbA family oxidoreductase [Brachybacterium sp. J153]|uniref:DsbA family oxidoreductase n=1 Tax=Brachybacterium sp. J153 TaxID=3116488 RepID=UPI002E76461E|nr:DsbA family oxidoreductase [Brachybacterium sp. J153]MEE1618745.1 DsbA family oxidoreductase [Brachybacterium sp. J153]
MTANPQPATEPLITVDVWTDVVCPWCYIGESRLHDAIAAEGLEGQVRLRAHSFELDPTSPVDSDRTNIEHLTAAKGIPATQVREMEENIRTTAEELGREYVTERPMANTRGVHRVMQAISAAHGADAATSYFMDLQRDYFTGAGDPFDADAVVRRAVTAGLAEDVARDALEGRSHDDAVEAEVREAVSMGARGVPFFLFNDKYTAPGALPLDAFRQALRQIAEEARGERSADQA